ncbi:MAG: hypothetical protein JJU29_12735 [Verrucomicrobia bacterium]|nr:hypothetical protein [Verrucomicrobiota bacterium]MCH8512637.1 hypothetical protein [Kiritimatiellia bacterium]
MTEFNDDKFQKVQEERWSRLLLTLLPLDFGTCWWVKEKIWKEKIRNYDQNSDREGHPGLCIRQSRGLKTLKSLVPMLHGSSTHKVGYPVWGISPKKDKATWFGHVHTTCISLGRFREKDNQGDMMIQLNRLKPRLDDPEAEGLRQFLQQTGIYE